MRIIIYTRNNCVQCHATKRAMESRGFDFEMVNVDLQPDLADNLRDQGFRPDMINRLHPEHRVASA
ncbi:TPA: NrdH-redoxin [Citrobacter freundii]|uniref:glutaredoxin domain-containing protein n=1 Tax=Citrobacter freundii TaxID=546 RepID=UPI001A2B6915|nr:glutaredoxin domain-containing protein [Citrobacter freundii]MDC8909268.1 glutaredoxin domain-containing protein [Citrobacter freundii]HAU5822524.1 NrdH-redoxin [Citrobacter freundii]